MTDKQIAWEKILVLILIALIVLTQTTNFSNADISLPALVTAVFVLLISIAGKHHASN